MTPSNNTKHPLWTMMAPPLYSYETPIKFTQTLTAKYCWDSPRVALSARLTSQVRFHWKAGGGRAGSDGRGALYLKIDRVSTRIVQKEQASGLITITVVSMQRPICRPHDKAPSATRGKGTPCYRWYFHQVYTRYLVPGVHRLVVQ